MTNYFVATIWPVTLMLEFFHILCQPINPYHWGMLVGKFLELNVKLELRIG